MDAAEVGAGVDVASVNASREANPGGFYESYFCRANHPSEPLAFWIRYTMFRPQGRPADAVGELWAVLFDGNTGEHVAAKREVPFGECMFSPDDLDVEIGTATLQQGALTGGADGISWNLQFSGDEQPLLLLPSRMYERGFPKAKSLVAVPQATFSGTLDAGGRLIDVDGWVGSQNHNWGSRHTDTYAWGQVAGFDNSPATFLEVSTARVKVGPFRTPHLTPLVLRHDGEEHAFNAVLRSIGARGKFVPPAAGAPAEWTFSTGDQLMDIEGRITAPAEAFVGLRYANPPGGSKICLNTKIASCELRIFDRRNGAVHTLMTENRAAFEILGDRETPGVEVRV